MRVTFRQGIARYQTDVSANPTFLQRSTVSGYIDLVVSPDPTIIVFAHKNATYVFEEIKTVRQAWGPISGTQTQYLFWDVNVLTGELTRGITNLPPIHSGIAPPTPGVGQHWFDALATVMKVWESPGRWVEKIRVFAGYITSGSILKPYGLGSQVGIIGEFEAGNILFDAYFKPLRQSDGSFLTSATTMAVPGLGTRRISFETEVTALMANEYIAKHQLVRVQPGRKCILAQSIDPKSRVIGVAAEDMYLGETSIVVTYGLIRNALWSWTQEQIGKPLFAGPSGELTLVPAAQGVHQKVGMIYDSDAIFVRVEPAIVLDPPNGITVLPPPLDPALPVVDFSVVPFGTASDAPFVVQFQDLSTNTPTSWEWDFTNDGSVDSVLQNPQYTFSAPGTYNVRLKAGNAFGTSETVKTGYITVTSPPSTGAFTNLEANLSGPSQVGRNSLFTMTLRAQNDGYLTATNVVRSFEVLDVDGQQVMITGLPAGSTSIRSTTGAARTIVTLPTIPVMVSGSTPVITPFTLQAPGVTNQLIRVTASVYSPEMDIQTGDNTVSLFVRVI